MRHHQIHRTAPLATFGIVLLFVATPGGVTSQFSILNSQFTAAAQTAAAQPPSASLDQLLRELSTYDGGIDSAAWWNLRDYVYARKDDDAGRTECEGKLLLFVKSKATPAARMAATRLLRIIAADSAVPALQAMLADDRLADLAIYVLQPMPGAAADKALLQALSSTKGATRVAAIAAAGERRLSDAVPVLAPLLSQPNVGKPAALALGAIGTEAAAQALAAAYAGATATSKPALAAGSMKCAERALAAGNAAAALGVYERLWADRALPDAVRTAAAVGRIAASGPGGAGVILELLATSDPAVHQAAIGRVRDTVAPGGVGPLCTMLPRLPEASQVALLASLSGYPREQVLPTILEAARSNAPAVRLAALRALPAVGDATTVSLLLETASTARGPEQAAARAALGGLKGHAVDEALAARLAKKPADDEEVELLRAIAERRFYPARPAVAAALQSASSKTRLQALESLRVIGTPSDVPAVLELMLKTADDTERSGAEATVSSLTQKVSRADQRAREVKARLAAEKDPDARARLLGLLPLVGDASTLPVLRAALDDTSPDVRDAAVRALTAWPTHEARDDIFRLARDSRNETHRLLAIHGLIRIIGVDRYRDPQAAVADLRLAAGFAWRPEEQKLVLGALGQFACKDALEMATGFLQEPEVKAEAQAAMERIGKALK
ncbi:MAG: hypothetical protein EHM24_12595 [Acidobacteria bacterium]|nr:MAG: hypothetical protein EHM24_12595 [Acidobacteriota bacterium]